MVKGGKKKKKKKDVDCAGRRDCHRQVKAKGTQNKCLLFTAGTDETGQTAGGDQWGRTRHPEGRGGART